MSKVRAICVASRRQSFVENVLDVFHSVVDYVECAESEQHKSHSNNQRQKLFAYLAHDFKLCGLANVNRKSSFCSALIIAIFTKHNMSNISDSKSEHRLDNIVASFHEPMNRETMIEKLQECLHPRYRNQERGCGKIDMFGVMKAALTVYIPKWSTPETHHATFSGGSGD